MVTSKIYKPSNTTVPLKANVLKSLGNKDVFVVLDGKYYVLECVVEYKDWIELIGGREVFLNAVPTM